MGTIFWVTIAAGLGVDLALGAAALVLQHRRPSRPATGWVQHSHVRTIDDGRGR